MIGIAAGLGVLAGVSFGMWGAVAFAAIVVAVCACFRVLPSVAAVTIVVLLTVVGVWRHHPLVVTTAKQLDTHPNLSELVVVSNPDLGGSFQQFVASPSQDASTRVCVTIRSLPVVEIGDQIVVEGEPGRPQDAPLRVQRFLRSRGCAVSVFAQSFQIIGSESAGQFRFGRVRPAVSERLRDMVPGDAGALLAGLVVGDDTALSRDRESAFTNTGTTHLTAVSGSNLALIAGILLALGRASVGQHRLGWQVVTIAGLWAFALISGAEPPAVRAAIVATVALLAVRFGRAADFPTLILLAAGVMALIEPGQVTRLGFQLSVAASLALAVTLPAFANRGISGALTGIVTVTVVAQLATLPFLLAAFGTVTTLSIPANALIAPLAGVAMPLAGAAGIVGLANAGLGEIVVTPAAVAAEMVIAIVDRLGSASASVVVGIPPAETTVVLAGTCALLIWLLATKRGA